MSGTLQPVADERGELVGRETRVRGHHDLEDRRLAAGERVTKIALPQRGEGLLRLPLRVRRRERLDAIQREGQLEVDRLLGPERAVVVEYGDPLAGWNEVWPVRLGHPGDEPHDRSLRRPVIPRRQILGRSRVRGADEGNSQ